MARRWRAVTSAVSDVFDAHRASAQLGGSPPPAELTNPGVLVDPEREEE
jgi:hypothetical protein